ncbi:hypothetical protein GX50_08357 [[Emmonsia] crescens]|uniref:Kinesin light chain n=1 Tax=[Emmonsia] crescens TaxID=73230 RepID=A0A2B7Z4S7_9EURO|nr:hypothetical protein GX50_08357 [Emmonsia crescens]
MEMSKQILGPEHPDTLCRMSNLVSIYHGQEQWKEAEELGVQVMKMTKQILGPEDPDTVDNMIKLITILESSGKAGDAGVLIDELVQLSSPHLSADHPDTPYFPELYTWLDEPHPHISQHLAAVPIINHPS